ncbi:fungal specific transcription factor domain-containing protein [Seiridium cupressi]
MRRGTPPQATSRQACAQCHIRKVKCDATEVGFPCTNCRTASREDCRLHLKRKRVSAKLPQRGPVPFCAAIPSASPQEQSLSPKAPTPVPKVEVFNLLNVDVDAAADGEYVFRRHLVEFIDQPQLTERPIDQHARTTYVGTDVSNISFLVRQQFGDKIANISHFPTNRIARRHTCYEPDRLPVEAFQLPEKSVVDRLLAAYFKHVNPGFPVVDEVLFMRQYQSRDPENPPSLLLLHSMLVVGAHVCFDQPNRESLKATFFRRAKSLFDARFERNRDVIVQAALLLTWHADGPEDVIANAWYWLGIAVRTATGMGMHRDAEKSTLVPHVKRMWRRVWWLLFQCDTLVSLQYGRPQSIHLGDSDVQKLKPSDFEDCGTNTRVSYVVQATELCVIIADALRERFRLGTTLGSRQDTLRKTDEAFANWALHLPTILQLRIGPTLDLWASNLHLIYNTALILLHRAKPYPLSASGVHGEDADICKTAASVIQNLFQCLCERNEIRYLWTSSINCLFTALIELSVEVRLSNPVLAISALRRYDSALFSLRELARYWPNAQSILHFFESSVRLQETRRGSGQLEANTGAMEGLRQSPLPDMEIDQAASTAQSVEKERNITSRADPERLSEAPSLQGVPEAHDELPQMYSQMPVEEQDPTAMRDYALEGFESWNQWRQTYWQQPEFTDEFLFTF